MTRRLFRLFIAVSLLALVAVGGIFGWGYDQFHRPGPEAIDRDVLLVKGSSLKDIAGRLAMAGIIVQPLVFRIGVRVGGWSRGLKAGEFRFPAHISMRGAVDILRKGETVLVQAAESWPEQVACLSAEPSSASPPVSSLQSPPANSANTAHLQIESLNSIGLGLSLCA